MKRIFKTAFSNIWRQKFISFATITVISLILFIFNIIMMVNFTIGNILAELNQKVDIIVYLKDSTDFIEAQNVIDELKQLEGVKDVKYTSKEEALQKVLEEYAGLENPFNKYGIENKLPANIQILTTSTGYHAKIISFLRESSYRSLLSNIESNQETQKIAQKLQTLSNVSKKVGVSMLVGFMIAGIIIILNGIHLTIYNRKEELTIMKLVGATPAFIKLPFIIEGIMLGLAASIINTLIIISITDGIELPYPHLEKAVTELHHTAIFQVIGSMIIGSIGSFLATNNYLSKNALSDQ